MNMKVILPLLIYHLHMSLHTAVCLDEQKQSRLLLQYGHQPAHANKCKVKFLLRISLSGHAALSQLTSKCWRKSFEPV